METEKDFHFMEIQRSEKLPEQLLYIFPFIVLIIKILGIIKNLRKVILENSLRFLNNVNIEQLFSVIRAFFNAFGNKSLEFLSRQRAIETTRSF